ncbi:MAG: protein-(glutamine-N5) methyltransferase, release factor-specific [SAR86 cluster bacterium]|uniref:Release factor glutamine methyltransferase n=1 Tax=SAR86 cluster bacterium TaxID=2030880 RepID=A0A2A5B3W1_9GAMM|nr:MAG: protein-(glutamine-N5) methyltransferase, release factor-specific [SAR86 cluster bacterium]
MLTIKQALEEARQMPTTSDSWKLDAELLLADAIQSSRETLYTWPERELTEQSLSTFRSHCSRRQQGEPIAYILGKRAFWDFELQVNHHVLIPRPETELLVETAIEILQGLPPRKNQSPELNILDLGTGSGAIALAIARENQDWKLTAVDFSEEALEVARLNASALKVSNIEFRQASWCDGLENFRYDMIVANPPYVASDDDHLQQGDISFEPLSALVAKEDGLADIRQLVSQSREILKKDSWLLIEHGYNQKEQVAKILGDSDYSNINCKKDLAGIDRMTAAKLSL